MSDIRKGILRKGILRKGILGAAAITLTFGAAQFAFGEDLTVGMRTSGTEEPAVNRASKADRAPILAEPVAPTHTLSIHIDSVPDTSVLVRLPLAQEARNNAARDGAARGNAAQGNAVPALPQNLPQNTGERKIACEPVVSVLTEIAKSLQPGRCVT
jgi:hypothetical protein